MEDRELGATTEVIRSRKERCMTEEERSYIEKRLERYTYAVDSLIDELRELTSWSKELHIKAARLIEAKNGNQ